MLRSTEPPEQSLITTYQEMTTLTGSVSKSVEGFINFINKSPTAFHYVNNVKTTLTSAGFNFVSISEMRLVVCFNISCLLSFEFRLLNYIPNR
jgi:hypothetical protein